MDRIKEMDKNRDKLLGKGSVCPLEKTDPELVAIRDRLIYGEIIGKGTLGEKRQELVTLAALTASQAEAPLKLHAGAALNAGATPVEVRETIYQTAPYVGFPRAESAMRLVNEVFEIRGVKLPLENQGAVTEESRLKDGLAAQGGIFGAGHINKMRDNAPEGQKEIIANYLTAYCFGDFYTRKGLDIKMREIITFSAIVALGGCDPQAKAHAAANVAVGNTRQNLVDALAVMLPYIGFPRTLNGLAAVNAAVPEK